MPAFPKRNASIGLLVMAVTLASSVFAQGIRFRDHDETQSFPLELNPATADPGENIVEFSEDGDWRIVIGNGIPAHLVGAFPNGGNPNEIAEQIVSYQMPLQPAMAAERTPLAFGWNFGITIDGVVFDPLAAEFWDGDPQSGWSYNALGGAFDLGLDANHAHVQPTGAYHYHGKPTGLLERLGWTSDAHSPLVGYAADGFPIYAVVGQVSGELVAMTSSYQLKPGDRPGGVEPDGAYDGTFLEDFEYVAGSGTLDECNGAMTVSPEFPGGTYAYFLSVDYPVVPRCFVGTPDESFRFGPAR